MKKYYLHKGAGQNGPFDIEDLKTKQILKETPIWYDGLSDWTIADKIDELKILFRRTSPEASETKQDTPAIVMPKKNNKFGTNLIILLLALIIIFAVFAIFYNASASGN
jgi:hypothetical protein